MALILILLCLFALKSPNGIMQDVPTQTEIQKNENTISVPGYEVLTLKANSLQQEIALSNPPQNTCIFIISLYLEDGTLLWQSDEIKPGEQSSPIRLIQPLKAGTYANARLVYSCYTDDAQRRQLNGADMKLNLRVQ